MGEFALLARLFRSQGVDDGLTEVANGDDASVHTLPAGESLVVSSDSALEEVHWPRGFDLQQAADRALQAALSDLAAMGAVARWCWVALMAQGAEALEAMGRGVLRGAARSGVVVAGGDSVRAATNGLTVTVAGTLPSGTAMCRGGAKVGDGVWLFGAVGLAAAGLRQWRQGERSGAWIDAFARVNARLAEGVALRAMGVRCCIDVSDGLVQDAGHLAEAGGVRLLLTLDALPQVAALSAAWDDALDLVISGGEDYALLCCAEPQLEGRLAGLGGVRIGAVAAGAGVEVRYRGRRVEAKRGFDHFAARG